MNKNDSNNYEKYVHNLCTYFYALDACDTINYFILQGN
jgi:hypothetical protein